ANGDLPGPENPVNTTPVEVLEEPRSGGTDEGRAMMELIHDIAPGANLAFHTASGGRANFAEGINDLVEAGADIIVDDIGYRTQPFFQDGLVAQAAQEAVSQGIPFFSAAGNNGSQSYESEFRVGKNLSIPQLNSSEYVFHDFDASSNVDSLQQFTLEEQEQIDLSFQWDEPFASVGPVGSSNDLDMFLLNESGDNLVTQSTDFNVGNDPIELLNFQNTTGESQTYNLAIGRFEPEGGSNPGLIKYINFGDEMENLEFDTDSSTIFGHPNAEGVAGVGATSFQNTPEFGTNPPQVESFSSKGGTPILFDREGNRLSEPEIRDQPRFTAPDKTNTSFFPQNNDLVADSDNFPNFPGTSAAAPHAAAVGALMLEAAGGSGSLAPEQIYQTLENTAIDIGEEGFNFKSGFGFIQADQAVETIINENQSPVADVDNFTTSEGIAFTTGNVLDNDSDPENDSLSITEVDTTETLGKVTNNEDGTFEYNPNGAFEDLSQGETATDAFTYTVSDGNGNTETAKVTITIEGIQNEENSSTEKAPSILSILSQFSRFANGNTTVNLNNNSEITVGNEALGVNEKADIGNINFDDDYSTPTDNLQASLFQQNQFHPANVSQGEEMPLSQKLISPSQDPSRGIDDSELANESGSVALTPDIGNDLF
ncbi:MAG: Ig-like domain-containing protein, partial [Halothece sp.]